MANIIIKSDERKQREQKVLREFDHNPHKASRETREQAEYVAEKTHEIIQKNKK